MRAIVHRTFGEPAGVLVVVEDRTTPEPGPGAVRVRVLLSPIHNHDLTVPVAATYGFDDVQEAARADFEPGRVGKILLRP